jgi:AraC-like DNA-binding protein
MASFAQNPDERLAALPLPLRSLGIDCDVTIDHLPTASDRVFGPRQVFSDQQASSRTQFALVDVGQIACVCGRTSPIVSIQEQPERATLFLCYAGQPHYREGRLHLPLRPGSILVNPNHGGQYRSRFSTNLCFRVQRQTLQRTILAMSGLRIDSVLVEPEVWGLDAARTGTKLFDLFGFIDQLLARDRNLPTALGLDDQIHRILALLILTREGHADRLEQRSPRRLASLSRLDDLVDYIRANRARALTLTDLEMQSSYSARHLQSLFRERFDCTPMQFVRRQRLSLAMAQLETAGPGDSVTRIARSCGYGHLSNFTSDFRREFGVTPSQVLRGAVRSAG